MNIDEQIEYMQREFDWYMTVAAYRDMSKVNACEAILATLKQVKQAQKSPDEGA